MKLGTRKQELGKSNGGIGGLKPYNKNKNDKNKYNK